MGNFKQLEKEFKKDYGEEVGGAGYALPEFPRLPTGYFGFDLASGGGIPMGKFIEIFGKEGSCKTVFALKLIANMQRMYPDKENAFFDIENTYDPKWAAKLGVDTDKLYVYNPDYGEQIIDMVEGLLGSPDCGLIVLDSLAAIATTRELGQSAEKMDVGGGGLLASKLVRKVNNALGRSGKEDNVATFVAINQIRHKIGIMFGDPETTPGGFAPKFAASMRVRLYGKDVKDAKYNKHLAVFKDVRFTIKKHKCPIVCPTGDIRIAMVGVPEKELGAGDGDEFKLLKKYMEEHSILLKDGTKWILQGKEPEEFTSLKAVKDRLINDPDYMQSLKQAIIDQEVELAIGDSVGEQDKKAEEQG